MSSLSNSVGEGIDSGFGDKFVNTGYGTYSGAGNVRTGTEDTTGTGFDEHGQVKTKFGKWPIKYDPVTGTATTGVTQNYDFPPSHLDPGDVGGLTDVSISPEGHSTMADKPSTDEKKHRPAAKPHSEETPENKSDRGDGGSS